MPTARKQQMPDPDEHLTAEDLAHFKDVLEKARLETTTRSLERVHEALDTQTHLPDEADEASNARDQAFELRLADKDRKLIGLIDHALRKIEMGDFGYCEGTGEPIPKARLELRPWARYSVEYKDKLEKDRQLHGL